MNFFKKLFKKAEIKKEKNVFNDTIEFWQDRANKHGKHSVYNMGHSKEELEIVDTKQKEIYTNVLKKYLVGDEKTAMDFGCGPGRFTEFLTEFVSEKVYGIDPIKSLLDLAPKEDPKIEYLCCPKNTIDLPDKSIDFIFISLVLGGIVDEKDLRKTIEEIKRVASDKALFFIVENTAKISNASYWHFRTQKEYIELFAFASIKIEKTYEDLGEEISVFVGRIK